LRQVRLICGLILFCYLLSHYSNHALGNISLNATEYGLWFHVALWQSVVGTLLLYSALGVHGSLGLLALYQRPYFRWKITEIVQLEYDTAKREYILISRGGRYLQTGYFWRRHYWWCHV
jgi:adenylate cyclase